jgi:hypothetical protein
MQEYEGAVRAAFKDELSAYAVPVDAILDYTKIYEPHVDAQLSRLHKKVYD